MRFTIFCLLAVFYGCQMISAQGQEYNIEYYKLTKIRKDNVTKSVYDNYGIYTTRVKQICYDSYSNGTMNYMSDLKYDRQSNGLKYYSGKCYLDRNCFYVFNDSKGILNVSLSNGDVYVYQKTSAPAGRKNGEYYSTSSGGGGDGGYYVPPTTTTPSSNGSVGGSSNNSRQKQAHPKKCTRCLGNGVCPKCSGKGTYHTLMYGANKLMTCPSCNGSGKCSMCHGSGTYGTSWY